MTWRPIYFVLAKGVTWGMSPKIKAMIAKTGKFQTMFKKETGGREHRKKAKLGATK